MLAELDESGLPMDKLGLFLRVLKHIYDENFLEIYENLVPALQALDRTEGDRGFVIAVNRYLVTSANMENLAKFSEIAVKSFSEETGGAAMTLSEVIQREGEKRTMEKIVKNMLKDGFDYQTIARITGLSHEEIDLLTKKAS